MTRVTTDIEHLNEMFTSGVIVLFFDLVKVVVVLAGLFTIHWKLALVVLGLTPLLIGVSLAFRGGARRAHRVVRARLARLNGYLQEVLSGIRVVQIFRREGRVSARFEQHLDEYLDANKRTIYQYIHENGIKGYFLFGSTDEDQVGSCFKAGFWRRGDPGVALTGH